MPGSRQLQQGIALQEILIEICVKGFWPKGQGLNVGRCRSCFVSGNLDIDEERFRMSYGAWWFALEPSLEVALIGFEL